MVQAILKFDLDNFEKDDRLDFECMLAAKKMELVLSDMLRYLREEIKWGEHDSAVYDTFEKVREKMVQTMEEHRVYVD